MKKSKTNKFIEFLPLTFILSYFLIHNIFLVLLGIIFSLYLIYINIFNNFKRSISNISLIKNLAKSYNQKDIHIESNSIDIKSTEQDSTLTLVKEIEELGYIPSLNKSNDSKAA